MEARSLAAAKPFSAALAKFEELTDDLQTKKALRLSHDEMEGLIDDAQREVSRLLLEEGIRLRGTGDVGSLVAGADGVERTHRRERERGVKTIFGEIAFTRVGYGKPGAASLFPLDGALALSADSYSLSLRRMLGNEIAKNSYDEGVQAVKERTGVAIGKRQAEELSQKAAVDFDLYYERQVFDPSERAQMASKPLLVLTTDGKGIVMRPDDLREATRKRAEEAKAKLQKRVSKGEKRNAKRMAQVASVYNIDRYARTPEQVAGVEPKPEETPPRPIAKRVWASVEKEQATVIKDMFGEAEARDPGHKKEWVALIDGQLSQLGRIEEEAERRKAKITVVIDVIHVIEYIWKAARCFFPEEDPKGEEWVTANLLEILRGKAKLVAAAMRRSATCKELEKEARAPVDKCADYLHNNDDYLRYDRYLASGYPIATGVIEGACRHLVKDRMDITGARWSLRGAEAVLKLRSLHASGDLKDYWAFHKQQELERNHESNYAKPAVIGKGLRLLK